MDESKQLSIVHEALERYDVADDAMKDVIKEAEDDIAFAAGAQWPDDVVAERKGRPNLTINKLQTLINQVANDQRQNRPSVIARPVDSNIDKETARIINGTLRHIQYNSESSIAFDTACDHAITCGLGYVRVATDYCNDYSFDQEIKIQRIEDPLMVRFPIHICKKADWSDATYAFLTYEMARAEFELKCPDQTPASWQCKNSYASWVTKDTVTLCEYFKIETKSKKIYEFADGSVGEYLPQGFEAVRSRDVEVRTVRWYLITAGAVLDEKEWIGSYIPIIPILGKEIIVKGKKHYISLIRNAKDAQRMLNYWKSLETEMIALAPKAPFIGAEGQFENHEREWQSANMRNTPYLEYKPITIAGQPVGAPQRSQQVQIPTAIVNAINEAKDDIKETTGIFDASIGARSNETSGRAILARQREGDTGTFHFIDNLTRGMQHCFRIIVQLIPKIYDTERVIRIIGEDMKDAEAVINSPYINPETGVQEIKNPINTDKYDIVVDVGPSYTTKRIEAAESMTQFMQALPMQAPLIADLAARNMDWQGADEIAKRLRADLQAKAPHIFTDESADGEPMKEDEIRAIIADLTNLQQAMQAKEQETAQLEAVIAKMQAELESKEADRRVEIEKELIKSQTAKDVATIQSNPKMLTSLTDTAQAIRSSMSGEMEDEDEGPEPEPNSEGSATPSMGEE
jgi:hypothetical protein